MLANDIETLGTDAARRQVDDALKGGVILATRDEAQIRECVLDFGSLEEAQAAVHLVGYASGEEHFFKYAGLGVRAIEDGDITAVATTRDPVLDALQHELRLVALVEGGIQPDRFALAAARPQVFAESTAVMGDECVGRLENGAGRAVVLLQSHQLGLREIAAERLQIFDASTAPAVDRLIVVADGERRTIRAHEQLHPCVLDGVRVLEFVDQHVAEAASVMAEQLGLVAPQFEGAQQQFSEIDHACPLAGVLVILVELDQLAPGRIVAVLQRLRTHAFVLVLVDEVLHIARYPAGLVEALCLEQLLDESQLIVAVQNLEGLWQARLTPVQPKQAMRDAMKGADPQRCAGHAKQRLDAGAHLAGRLVGEGHGDDAMDRGFFSLHQPDDAVGEHAGLAAARAGEHEHGTDGRGHGFALRFVQRVEDRGKVHGAANSSGFQSL